MLPTIGYGIYGYREAARLTGLRPARIREWFRNRKRASDRPLPDSFLPGDYKQADGRLSISFLDLIDVYIAGQLRDHGVSLQVLRKVHRKMGENLETEHPFCRMELRTDGKDVFLRNVDVEGEEELREVLTRQMVFPKIIAPFLKRIDYDTATLLAERWRISNGVIVDPKFCYGHPCVENVLIPTSVLKAEWEANNRDARLVAMYHKIRPEDVEKAINFEVSFSRAA